MPRSAAQSNSACGGMCARRRGTVPGVPCVAPQRCMGRPWSGWMRRMPQDASERLAAPVSVPGIVRCAWAPGRA
jgi:hypothetical protein